MLVALPLADLKKNVKQILEKTVILYFKPSALSTFLRVWHV